MAKRSALFSAVVMILGLACSTAPQDSTANVQKAVEKHLSSRTDLNPTQLKVTVDKVDYEGDSASASVTIQARDDPQAKMQMVYRLRKSGDGWQVEPQTPASSGGHGGSRMPEASPAPEGGAGAELPPGHPAVGGASESDPNALPPGHPPVSGSQQPKSKTQ